MSKRVILIQVFKNFQKLESILNIITKHFENSQKFLIYSPDEKALEFMNTFLWKTPKTSFLPHIISNKKCDDFLVLTKKRKNLNNSSYIFNLSKTALFIEDSFKVIYDFEDLSTDETKLKSKEKFNSYREKDFLIESF